MLQTAVRRPTVPFSRKKRSFLILLCCAFVTALCSTGQIKNQPVEFSVLLYLTTQASAAHLSFLKVHWPKLLEKSRLLRSADVFIFSTGNPALNEEMKSTFSKNPSCAVQNFENPGLQEGANLAVSWGIYSGLFKGYDWIIRLNPDVIIVNDTWISKTLKDDDVDAIFVDCFEKCLAGNCTNDALLIHTDFFAVRPRVLKEGSFNSTTFYLIGNAERVATHEFQNILYRGKHRWLPGVGPMQGNCRVRGKDSPIIHSHDSNINISLLLVD